MKENDIKEKYVSNIDNVNNHFSQNTNSNLILQSHKNVHVENRMKHESSLDISNIRKKVDSDLNASSISNNFERKEEITNTTDKNSEMHTESDRVKKLPSSLRALSSESVYHRTKEKITITNTKEDEMTSDRIDLSIQPLTSKNKKCSDRFTRVCIIKYMCILLISLSLFLFLKWKLHF